MSKFVSNSFQVPNAFVDDVLNQLSGNACKIYLLIVRKTRGWHKEADRISYSQIQKSTGIGSSATVDKAISELVDFGLISYKKGNEKSANEYRLNDAFCTSKTEVGGTSKTEDTEIHIFKNTYTKDKGEYDNDTHTQDQTIVQDFEHTQTTQKKTDEILGKSKSKTTKSKLTDCPDRIIYTSSQLKKCQEHNFDIDDLFDDFRDWHTARGNQFKCWVSAFSMWIKKQIEFKSNKQPFAKNSNQQNFKEAFRDPQWEEIYGNNFYGNNQPAIGE